MQNFRRSGRKLPHSAFFNFHYSLLIHGPLNEGERQFVGQLVNRRQFPMSESRWAVRQRDSEISRDGEFNE